MATSDGSSGENENDDFYEVEKLLDVRPSKKDKRKLEFLVLWKGFPREQATWVAEDDLGTGCAEFMANLIAEKHREEAIKNQAIPKDAARTQLMQTEPSPTVEREAKEVDSILGAIKEGGNVMLLVKWHGGETKEMIPSKELRKKSPQKLIEYYQSKLKFI